MVPKCTQVLVVNEALGHDKPLFHDAQLETRPLRPLKAGEVLVKITAVSFNHRDVRSVTF